MDYFELSLKYRDSTGDRQGQAISYTNIGSLYVKLSEVSNAEEKKNLLKARGFCLKSLNLSKEIGYPENIRNASQQLFSIYKRLNDPKNALEMYELYVEMRDSFSNDETKKSAIKNQLKYEYEKRAAADSVKNAEEQKVKNAQLNAQQSQLKQEKTQRYALYGGLVLIIAFSVFVFNRFRITRRQKVIIEKQKEQVDHAYEKLHEKNKEVMDSIYYARRIQRALITSEKYIERNLSQFLKKS